MHIIYTHMYICAQHESLSELLLAREGLGEDASRPMRGKVSERLRRSSGRCCSAPPRAKGAPDVVCRRYAAPWLYIYIYIYIYLFIYLFIYAEVHKKACPLVCSGPPNSSGAHCREPGSVRSARDRLYQDPA